MIWAHCAAPFNKKKMLLLWSFYLLCATFKVQYRTKSAQIFSICIPFSKLTWHKIYLDPQGGFLRVRLYTSLWHVLFACVIER